MCNKILIEDIDPSDVPSFIVNNFNNLVIEDITDSDNESISLLAQDEEMLESDQESISDHSNPITFSELFRKGMHRMNFMYNMHMFPELIEDETVHLQGLVHMCNDLNSSSLLCNQCYNNNNANIANQFTNIIYNMHYLLTGDEFSLRMDLDTDAAGHEYFCSGCNRFLFHINNDMSALSHDECDCKKQYHDYFETEMGNAFEDSWAVGYSNNNEFHAI